MGLYEKEAQTHRHHLSAEANQSYPGDLDQGADANLLQRFVFFDAQKDQSCADEEGRHAEILNINSKTCKFRKH